MENNPHKAIKLTATDSPSKLKLFANTDAKTPVIPPTDTELRRKLTTGVTANPHFPDGFLAEIPKTELHSHLDGGVRIQTLIDLAQEHDVTLPYYTEKEMRQHVFKDSYENLEEYLQPFGMVGSIMQTASQLERIAYEFASDSFKDNVVYVEIRFAPQLHASPDLEIVDVLKAVNAGAKRAAAEYNAKLAETAVEGEAHAAFSYGIIVCALRLFTKDFSKYYANLFRVHKFVDAERIYALASMALVSAALHARDVEKIPIVALDAAGAENGFPPQVHAEAFQTAHSNFLNITIHAAEGFGPESMFRAITDCSAERIGHGYHVFSATRVTDERVENKKEFVDKLVRYVADRRITLEVCLTSNTQTMPELKHITEHHLGKMIEQKMAVALCTDNRTVSNCTLSQEFRLAVDAFKLTPKQLKDMVIGSFKRSFFPGTYLQKREYICQLLAHYERIEKKYGVDQSESRQRYASCKK
jgi:adenosine deaminase